MQVQELRAYVRNHLEMDDEELPDVLLNNYLQDAFDRTMARNNNWPRNEKTWSLSKIADMPAVSLPPDLNLPTIMSVTSVADGYRIVQANHENAETTFGTQPITGITKPIYYSLWGGQLWLWPGTSVYDIVLRGYRQPVWTNAASEIPDLDERLHLALAYYAMGLAYAQQEDEILEAVYMARWDRDVASQMRAILEPSHHRPLVMNAGNPVGGTPSYVINLPVT